MANRVCFEWQGVEHWTGGDLMETIALLENQDEADDFITAYAAVCEDDDHALHNLRYLAYMWSTDSDNENAEEEAQRMCELFGLEMPKDDETIPPRQWFTNSSCGVKVAA